MLDRLLAAGFAVLLVGCLGAQASDPVDLNRSRVAPIHVDSRIGNDSNAGTASAPWKTLARLGKARLIKGQRIKLHCTSTWRETLDLGAQQLADDVTVESFGHACDGERPRILGSDDFSHGWTREGALWWRDVPISTPKIARLLVNGEPMQLARWPNATALPNYAVVEDTSPAPQMRHFTVALKHRNALTGVDLSGAIVQIRSAPWRIDAATIQTYDSATGKLTLGGDTSYAIPGGTDFVLQDKLWMLDSPGEYFHDVQRQRLYLYPPSTLQNSGPSSARVEGSVRDHGATLSGRKNLTLRGIDIENARDTGVTIQDAPNAQLTDIRVRNNHVVGIKLITSATLVETNPNPSVTLMDSVIEGSNFYGVDAGSAVRARILNNRIEEVGTRGDAGNSYAALRLGPASIAEGNHINRAAYIGIRFNGSGGSHIRNNQIEAFCARLGDCAAIYTWNGPKEKPNLVDQWVIIEGNTILGTVDRPVHTTLKSGWITAGIYLDDFSRNATVRDNVVGHTPIGIFVHNGSGHTIESNKVWLTTRAGLWANMDQTDADYMTGNQFQNNEIVPVALAQGKWPVPPSLQTSQAIWYWQKLETYDKIATSGNNKFSANRVIPLNESNGQHVRVRGLNFDSYLEAATWQRIHPGEMTAFIPSRFAPFTLVLGPELLRGGKFDTGWGSWGKWFSPQSVGGNAAHISNANGCDGGCIAFTNGNVNDLISSPSFNLIAGRPYQISMDATFPKGGAIAMPHVSRNSPPWDSLAVTASQTHLSRKQADPGQQIAYQSAFQASAAIDARLSIKLESKGVPAYLDNISLREIEDYSIPPIKGFASILSNSKGTARIVNCVDIGWPPGCAGRNIDGKPVSFPIAIMQGSPMLVLRVN